MLHNKGKKHAIIKYIKNELSINSKQNEPKILPLITADLHSFQLWNLQGY